MHNPFTAIASLFALFVICSIMSGCGTRQGGFIYGPDEMHLTDSQTKCIEDHVWGETILGSRFPVQKCAAMSGWSQENRN